MRTRAWIGTIAALGVTACSSNPRPATPSPAAADSARRADSLAAAARGDSLAALARRDSLARAQAASDSAARVAAERSRADSVRAQVLRDGDGGGTGDVASGLDPASEAVLAERVYFDFDRSDLKPEAQQNLDQKLGVLRANPRLEILIEGHCDERGPDEYNLALGNRRAAAVKRYLVEHGIPNARVQIVSYGEEQPADAGHDEAAWSRNRRAEFRVAQGAR